MKLAKADDLMQPSNYLKQKKLTNLNLRNIVQYNICKTPSNIIFCKIIIVRKTIYALKVAKAVKMQRFFYII